MKNSISPIIIKLPLTVRSLCVLQHHLHDIWNKNKQDTSLFYICSTQTIYTISESSSIFFNTIDDVKKVFTEKFLDDFLKCYPDKNDKDTLKNQFANLFNLKS